MLCEICKNWARRESHRLTDHHENCPMMFCEDIKALYRKTEDQENDILRLRETVHALCRKVEELENRVGPDLYGALRSRLANKKP